MAIVSMRIGELATQHGNPRAGFDEDQHLLGGDRGEWMHDLSVGVLTLQLLSSTDSLPWDLNYTTARR